MMSTQHRRAIGSGIALFALLMLTLVVVGSRPAKCPAVPDLLHAPPGTAPIEISGATAHWQGEMAGEVTQDSVILQARLTADGKVHSGDVKGCRGLGSFELSTDKAFYETLPTDWTIASPSNDYRIKVKVTGLEPGTQYY